MAGDSGWGLLVQATGGNRAAKFLVKKRHGWERQVLVTALFAMVGLVFLSAEFAFQRPVPSLAWLALLFVALLAGLETARVNSRQSDEAPSTIRSAAKPETPEPPAVKASAQPTGPAVVLSAVSHEIRTPINAIVGFSELLRDAERNASGQKIREEYANLVLNNARQLQNVVNDVLEANRLENSGFALNEQDCDIGEIVEVAARDCSGEAEARGITLIAHVATGIAVHGDTNRLKKAVACLISNAIKFSPSDGMVNINMLRSSTSDLVITITDAGAGLKPQDLERAFQPFSQIDEGTARQHGGLGLGLYISRQIARLHGGDLQIRSQTGVGTEARLSIPSVRVKLASAVVAARRVA